MFWQCHPPQGWIGALPWHQQSCSPHWVWQGWDEHGIKQQLQGDFPLFFLNEMAEQGVVISAVPILGCWVCGCPFPLLQPCERGPSYPVPGRFQVSLCEPPFVFCAPQLSSPFWFSSCCQVVKHFPGIRCRSPWPSHSVVYSWIFSFCISIWCI